MVKEIVKDDPIVAELAVSHPGVVPALERLGIDYCCGGKRKLSEAAAASGHSLEEVACALEEAEAESVDEDRDWGHASLAELSDHIVATHHRYLKAELPRLSDLFDKVIVAHGEHHGDVLVPLRNTFEGLREELEAHLMKEEQILFPLIRRREAGEAQLAMFPVGEPIAVMEHEHNSAGQALASMRGISDDYALPSDACPTFHNLYHSLQQLESDTHLHIHLENNVLFPRALEMWNAA